MKTPEFRVNGAYGFLEEGYAIDQKVDAIVHATNNDLILCGGAGARISDITGSLVPGSADEDEYNYLCEHLGRVGITCRQIQARLSLKPSKVQLDCLRGIQKRNGLVNIGSACMTRAGDFVNYVGQRPQYILHAVCSGYDSVKGENIAVNPESLDRSLSNAFKIIKETNLKLRTLAIPIIYASGMCVEGFTPEMAIQITLLALEDSKITLDKFLICADNKETKECARRAQF